MELGLQLSGMHKTLFCFRLWKRHPAKDITLTISLPLLPALPAYGCTHHPLSETQPCKQPPLSLTLNTTACGTAGTAPVHAASASTRARLEPAQSKGRMERHARVEQGNFSKTGSGEKRCLPTKPPPCLLPIISYVPARTASHVLVMGCKLGLQMML